MISLTGKAAVITGSTRGIGRVVAETLASLKCDVLINGTTEEKVARVAEEISAKHGVRTAGVCASVASEASAGRLIDRALEVFGGVHILVNNAGITRDNLLLRMKPEDWDEVMAVNLKGAFLCAKAAIRPMLKGKYGRIINMSSIVGEIGNAGQVNYSAAKGGLLAFTKALARELAAKSITVNAVAPGFIETDMTGALSEEARQALIRDIPLRRMGRAEDVANAVAFLASDAASYITGHTLDINGGMSM